MNKRSKIPMVVPSTYKNENSSLILNTFWKMATIENRGADISTIISEEKLRVYAGLS
jgi:hypothetical protein